MRNDRPPTVVLGVGNVLMRDDGVGVWIVRRLAERYRFPSGVRLIEGGVAGLALLPYLTEAGAVLIIDAVDREAAPGTLYRLGAEEIPPRRGGLSVHEVGISELLLTARMLGRCPPTRIIGIQPSEFQTGGVELTPRVKKAVPRAMDAVVEELREMGIVPMRRAHPGRPLKKSDAGRCRHA